MCIHWHLLYLQRATWGQQLPFSSTEGGGGAHTLLCPVPLLSTAQWDHHTVCSPAPLCNRAGRHSPRGSPPPPTPSLSTHLTVPVSSTQRCGILSSPFWARHGSTCWKHSICSRRGTYKHYRTWFKNQAVSFFLYSCIFACYPTTLKLISHSLPEFSSLVENIIENTVLNILMEANCGELNITAPMYKIAKPPHKALLDTDAV